jgi:hypothetical protein
MKYLFVLAAYSDYRQQIFDDVISPHNKEYCGYHGFKYVEIRKENNPVPFRGNLTWNKWSIIRDLITTNTLKDGDIIIQQDADVVNCDKDASYDLVDNKSMSICIDSGNTFCHGIFGLRINDWTRNLVNLILDDGIYNRLLKKYTIHEGFPDRPAIPFIYEFREQAVFYNLFGIKRHSWIPFRELPNNGIWSDISDPPAFDVGTANKHLDILPVEYNVTIWPDESDTTFYINKLDDRSKVKFRHFTGSNWEVAKSWVNQIQQ